jgi:hypothetical protein
VFLVSAKLKESVFSTFCSMTTSQNSVVMNSGPSILNCITRNLPFIVEGLMGVQDIKVVGSEVLNVAGEGNLISPS